jgi:hypothetical protein
MANSLRRGAGKKNEAAGKKIRDQQNEQGINQRVEREA